MKTVIYDAPDFSLKNQTGEIRQLQDFAGNWLVLYFYPKDDTPGCTTEACSMRDARDELMDLGAQVVGVSMDDAPTHEKFMTKYKLNFDLLSDTDGSVIRAYDAWGKKMFGREGILRKTFLINPEGKVVKVYNRVTPIGHGEQVVVELKKQQSL